MYAQLLMHTLADTKNNAFYRMASILGMWNPKIVSLFDITVTVNYCKSACAVHVYRFAMCLHAFVRTYN